MRIAPSAGADHLYELTPAATPGVLAVNDVVIEIAPRLPVSSVLFLASYALDPRGWRESTVDVGTERCLHEAVIPTYVHHVNAALRRGLLHGYRSRDDTLTTIRGCVRFADQLRWRQGRHLPVELTYDELTADVLENRLLLAATDRLLRMPLRSPTSRRQLHQIRELLSGVSLERFRSVAVPQPAWTRLNSRYRPAVTLARLILGGGATSATAGGAAGRSLLLDMPAVFEDFVVVALREALGARADELVQGARRLRLSLDVNGDIPLLPDLSWWAGGRCIFVGDCKYKRVVDSQVPNADLYQLLAYCTALDLDEGVLVYAAGEHDGGTYAVQHAGIRLHVVPLDLAGPPATVLAEVGRLADRVCEIAGMPRAA